MNLEIPGAICTLHAVSACNLCNCSPPRPITNKKLFTKEYINLS